MTHETLLEEIALACRRLGRGARVEAARASALVAQAAEVYVADPSRIRWWETLKVPAERWAYTGADGLTRLQELLAGDGSVYLVATDDEPLPWPVFELPAEDVAPVLQECRYFEYFLLGRDAGWILFDTHLNELIYATAPGHGPA